MAQNRRDFFKTAAIAAAAPAVATAAPLAKQPQGDAAKAFALGRKLTIASILTDGGTGLGVRTPHGVLDVAAAARGLGLAVPTTTDDFIHGRGDIAALDALVRSADQRQARIARYLLPEAGIRFAPALANPEKIICVGLNYRAHAAETNNAIPTVPVLFNKWRTSLNHHRGTIAITREPAEKWDYEAELVIVIGRTARNVAEAQALDHAISYCAGQDFTARDLQRATSQWMLGKCGDGWGPLGPWLVGADLIDPDKLDIKCLVNGEVRQDANTSEMIFNCRTLISFCSKHMTLNPGDVIFTGTPDGVINGYPPARQVWLKPGDRVVTRIEKLGDLEVTLV